MRGFTLVELVVVVMVIMVLTGVGIVSMSRFNNSKTIEGATEELINQIKLARNMAITNQLPTDVDSSAKFNFVKLNITSGLGITMTAQVGTSLVGTYFGDKKIESGIGLTMVAESFGFATGTGRLMDSLGVATSGPIVLMVAGSGNSKVVSVSDLGLIYAK